jgi:hypothetical protein
MYVYGNGKWHGVKGEESDASVRYIRTHCGLIFSEESALSHDDSVSTSAHFCSQCLNANVNTGAEAPDNE